MGFTRFVQNGRIALVNYGPDAGKLVMIVDVIDDKRCLCYGPASGVARKVLTYKCLSLTDIVVPNVGRGARKKSADAAYKAADVEGQWAATSWGKKLAARKAKTCANDFQRFQGMVAQKKKMGLHARSALKSHYTSWPFLCCNKQS